ncbi:DUF421 domain-containing protein [Lihuaxuella thermophila]|uniref:Uncharacterized membrane protein YcaP, DUF421 family n=1 Tax=Lihuaxuella thermophila TaxID=1173111 RepID=A0A1H8FWB9_9BACL|nr:DUF421 domain-containing protein [Lihuaxuella thermophila]SEN35388.1 Uncharacterized membrane protein YcaP, DUF421 family [Lihuaxuella thermophila]
MQELWTVFLRTLFIYFFILLMMRVMGKREIGKLSIFDLIVSFMIADISAIVLEETAIPLTRAIIPILTLVALQMIIAYISLKSRRVRHLVEGEPTVLIKDGQIQDAAMAKSRYSVDDLLMQLREKDIPDVSDVEFAILEPTGKLSIFPKEEKRPAMKEDVRSKHSLRHFEMPVPLIIEGKVQDDGLDKIGQTRFWLKNEIQKQGYKDFKEIYFASLNYEGTLYIDRKDPDKKH